MSQKSVFAKFEPQTPNAHKLCDWIFWNGYNLSLWPIENEKYADYINDIHISGTHLLSVISDILDNSKMELGDLELEKKDFDLCHATSACYSMVS